MDGSGAPARRGGSRVANGEAPDTVLLRAIEFRSSHHLLKGCNEDVGWRNAGSPCGTPAWTPERQIPISHSMGIPMQIVVPLAVPNGAGPLAGIDVRGVGPFGLQFGQDDVSIANGGATLGLGSARPVPRRIGKLYLELRWYTNTGEYVSPDDSQTIVYVTMDRPRDDEQAQYQEDGVTLKRMERAVAWVGPMGTLRPHSIVRALMAKFPYYQLKPSPRVPREYRHPTYFNDLGGAWPMSDYVAETGECQAIVRLVRGILRQLGIPGEARTLLVWADPEIEGGRKAVSAYWDEDPSAGLSRTKIVDGQQWLSALVDGPVAVGRAYPASHTILPDGSTSPGLNRYEACLEFTHDGVTRLYGGGAGIYRSQDSVISAFWGLVWVTGLPNEGFRVEQIVTRYQ